MVHDVVIVGGGPVGLFLACELRLAGASTVVLEREKDPQSPLKRAPIGLRGLSVATQEALDRRGLLTDALAASPDSERPAASTPTDELERPRARAGHFAGLPLDFALIDTARWRYRLPSPVGVGMVAVTMQHLQSVLLERACALGAEIVRGVDVDGIEQSEQDVIVRASGRTFRGRWIVGCDGGRSVVRKMGGFDFVGTEPTFTGYSFQVDLAAGHTVPLGRHHTANGMYMQPAPGTFSLADFDGGAFHRSAPITLRHVEDVLRRVTGIDVTVDAVALASTWTDRTKHATSYRRHRVLLAGDAAHIHSPLGGQGLNLGLGDAMNLGWKLGAVSTGATSADLLDGYHAERHRVAASVLDGSRAQVALLEPTAGGRALTGILRDLLATPDGATYFAGRMWGVDIRYDLIGRHPLVGRSSPDFELADGARLGVLLRDGVGVLLDFDHDPALQSLGPAVGIELRYVQCVPRQRLGLTAVLVRPDGIVAWASGGDPDPDEAESALSSWKTR